MKGLKKVSGETKSLRGCYDSIYLQLCYDKSKDEVFTIQHCDLGHSWQTYFDDEHIINLTWDSTYSGQFVLSYGDYYKTIVIESLFWEKGVF